jgi:ParB family chromosome partitioning protein
MIFEDVDKIKVKKRIRKDLGDIEGLKQSLQKFGLVSPIVITQKNELIAGHRRLTAARELGWKQIQVVRIDLEDSKDKLQWEIEENIRRKDFTHDELELAYLELARLSRPNFWIRLWERIKAFFRKLFGKKSQQ